MSLDGRIATAAGESKWITSEPARLYAHRLRLRYDAITVGIGTVLADDPHLNVRLEDIAESVSIHRIILDSRLRTPPDARIFDIEDGGDIIIATTEEADRRRADILRRAGATIIPCPESEGRVDLLFLMQALVERGISSLMIEGGGEVIASFLRLRLVDKITFVFAPIIIGGHNAVPVVGGEELGRLVDAFKLQNLRCFRLGPDMAIEGSVVDAT